MQLSIVGFDDLDFAEFTAPALTSVAPIRLSTGHDRGPSSTGANRRVPIEPQKIVLPSELKIRQSVASLTLPNPTPGRSGGTARSRFRAFQVISCRFQLFILFLLDNGFIAEIDCRRCI